MVTYDILDYLYLQKFLTKMSNASCSESKHPQNKIFKNLFKNNIKHLGNRTTYTVSRQLFFC